ncbi:hypothetical protein [Mycobacterium pseudoshottsii]|uniref:hypothetical protein n=1 Tax=Mycobacterium pseudoshottsii TaxID=265949 RepID=UPI000DC6D1D6|nr:hypothetical protein [Mycobacterium pseudoshottsii]BBA86646.1 hypothetical protein MPSD_09690 [Mycobacterium pseudoshottsii JCM 15466]
MPLVAWMQNRGVPVPVCRVWMGDGGGLGLGVDSVGEGGDGGGVEDVGDAQVGVQGGVGGGD